MATEQIQAQNFKGQQLGALLYGDIPDECPVCHTSVDPKRITASHRGEANKHATSRLQVVFQCTKNTCESIFISIYLFRDDDGQAYYRYIGSAPRTVKTAKFSEEIENTSPTFIEVY